MRTLAVQASVYRWTVPYLFQASRRGRRGVLLPRVSRHQATFEVEA